MTWIFAIGMALAAFAIAAFVFRLSRAVWSSLAAALAFGLAGYAWQASPDVPSAPKQPQTASEQGDFDVVAQRREFVGENERSRADMMFPADAMARRGRFVEASRLLSGITSQNPADFEAWLALGNALADHADGALTEPALYAYGKAAALSPSHPGPGYFLGIALIRQGRFAEARGIWAETLANAPQDAQGRDALAQRLARLDAMLGAAAQMQAPDGAARAPMPGQADTAVPQRDGD